MMYVSITLKVTRRPWLETVKAAKRVYLKLITPGIKIESILKQTSLTPIKQVVNWLSLISKFFWRKCLYSSVKFKIIIIVLQHLTGIYFTLVACKPCMK